MLKARAIFRDTRGSTVIEFALLAPVVIALMLGVLQIGVGMQAMNSLRSITAETARYATVEYQKENTPTNAAIDTQAEAIATGSPYNLDASQLTIDVVDATTQRVDGAREITVTVTYTVPTVLPFMGWASPTLTHERPIFVLD